MCGAGDKTSNDIEYDISSSLLPLLHEIQSRLVITTSTDVSKVTLDELVGTSLQAKDMYSYLLLVYYLQEGSAFIKDDELLKVYRELQEQYAQHLQKDIGMYKALLDTLALAIGKIIVDREGKKRAYEIFRSTGIVQEKYYDKLDMIAKPDFVFARCITKLQKFPEFIFSSCTILYTLFIFIMFITQCAYLSRFYHLAKSGMYVQNMRDDLQERFAYLNTAICTLQNDAIAFISKLNVCEHTSTDDLCTGLNHAVILHAMTHFKFHDILKEMYDIFENITPDPHFIAKSDSVTPEHIRQKLISRLASLQSISIYLDI